MQGVVQLNGMSGSPVANGNGLTGLAHSKGDAGVSVSGVVPLNLIKRCLSRFIADVNFPPLIGENKVNIVLLDDSGTQAQYCPDSVICNVPSFASMVIDSI